MQKLMRWHPERAADPEVPHPVNGTLVADALRRVPGFCDLLDGHLHDVIDQTEEAATAIVQQMAKVDSLADVMSGDVARLARTLSRTEQELDQLGTANTELVTRLIRYFTFRDDQIHQLVEEMRGLRKHVRQIEEVGKATNILALNAMIEAARAGAAGEGFTVVADEVRKLAHRSAEAATGIGASIAELTSRLDAVLSGDTNFDPAGDAPEPTNDTAIGRRLMKIAGAQHEMSELIAGILHDTIDAARQVESSSASLTSETTDAVGQVQFQDISRQMLEHVVSALAGVRQQTEDLVEYAEGAMSGDSLQDRMIDIDALREEHVMKRQRHTHAQSTGEADEADSEPAIELF